MWEIEKEPGLFVKEFTAQKSWLILLMGGKETQPGHYKRPFVVIPWTDASLIRVTRDSEGNVVNREHVEYRAEQPVLVSPPPAGHTYSMENTGGPVILEKRPTNPQESLPDTPLPSMPIENLEVFNRSGSEPWYFNAVILAKPVEWLTGFRYATETELPDDRVLFFDWGRPRDWSLWTKNVAFPIDCAFIDENGLIQSVHYNQAPNTDEISNGGNFSRAAIEAKGGALQGRKIRAGDKVNFRIFPGSSEPQVPLPSE